MREAHLETLLMRDLQLLIRTTVPFVKLKSILTTMAQGHAGAFSASSIARQVQLSTPTVLQMIRAFEDLFIIRSHGKEWYFCDVGMATYLGAGRIENPLFHMERFTYQELYAQLAYNYRAQFQFQSYLSRGGIRIPFLVRIKDSPWIAFSVDASEGGSEKSLKGLNGFEKKTKRTYNQNSSPPGLFCVCFVNGRIVHSVPLDHLIMSNCCPDVNGSPV